MYLFISLFILVISFLLFKNVAGSMSLFKLNLISIIFYIYLVLLSFIGAVLVVYNLDNHYFVSRFADDHIRFYGWASVLYTMIALPLGIHVSRVVLKIKSPKYAFEKYMLSPTINSFSYHDSHLKFPLYLMTFISMFAIVYIYSKLGTIPLIHILQNEDVLSFAQLRHEAQYGEFGGRLGFYMFLIASKGTPILTYIACAYWLKSKRKVDFIWLVGLLILCLASVFYGMSKSPFLKLFLGFPVLYIMMRGKLNIKKTLFVLVISVFIIMCAYTLLMGFSFSLTHFSEYNTGIAGRMIFGQIAGLFGSFYVFPDVHPFIGFNSVLPGFLNPSPSEHSTRILMYCLNPKGVEMGIAGAMSSLFIADAWACCGLSGLIIFPFYVGFLIGSFYFLFLKYIKKTPLILGLYAYLCFHLPFDSINTFIYDRKTLIPILMLMAAYLFGKMSRVRYSLLTRQKPGFFKVYF